MNRARENRFLQVFLIKINKINIFMTAEIEEMNAPLNNTSKSIYKKYIKSASLLSSRHRNKKNVSCIYSTLDILWAMERFDQSRAMLKPLRIFPDQRARGMFTHSGILPKVYTRLLCDCIATDGSDEKECADRDRVDRRVRYCISRDEVSPCKFPCPKESGLF